MLGIALLQLLRLRVIRKSCYSYPLRSPAQAIAFCWWIIHTAKSSAAKDKGPPTTPQVYWFLISLCVGLKSGKWMMEAPTKKKSQKNFQSLYVFFLTHQIQKNLQRFSNIIFFISISSKICLRWFFFHLKLHLYYILFTLKQTENLHFQAIPFVFRSFVFIFIFICL